MSMNIQLRLRSNKQLHVKNQGESIGMLIFAGGAVWEEKTSKNDTRVRSVATQEKGVRRVSRGKRVFKRIWQFGSKWNAQTQRQHHWLAMRTRIFERDAVDASKNAKMWSKSSFRCAKTVDQTRGALKP
jgi:hypothetical protein